HRHGAHMYLENLFAATNIRQRHHYLAVKAARTQQRGIEHVRTVCSGNHDNAFVAIEPVHLHQQLVQGLLALIMATTEAGATGTADRIDLVDKDDARCMLLRLLEHVAHTGCANTNKHLDKVGTGDREERDFRFAGNGFCQQRLAGTGRTHHQHATRNLAAKALELARVTQELDQLLHFFLGFLDTGNIGKGGLDLVFAHQARAALAEGHRATAATTTALRLAHEENKDTENQQDRQDRQQQLGEEALALRFGTYHFHTLLMQHRHQLKVQHRRLDRLETLATVELTGDHIVTDGDLLHPPLVGLGNEIGIGQTLWLGLGIDARRHYVEHTSD